MMVGQPIAFAVFCPPAHEYDYLVFASRNDAENSWLAMYDGQLDGEPEIVELFPVRERKDGAW